LIDEVATPIRRQPVRQVWQPLGGDHFGRRCDGPIAKSHVGRHDICV